MTEAGWVLVALALSGAASLARPGPLTALATAVLSACWLSANTVMEGPVLLNLSPSHGVTLADMGSVGGGALAVLSVLRWREQSPAPAERNGVHPVGVATRTRARAGTACLVAVLGILVAGAAARL